MKEKNVSQNYSREIFKKIFFLKNEILFLFGKSFLLSTFCFVIQCDLLTDEHLNAFQIY